MQFAKHLFSDNTLNLSGLLVIILVGGLAVFTESSNYLWPLIAALALVQLICFYNLVCGEKKTLIVQVILFWLQAACVVALFSLVRSSFVAILSIVWIIQATELYSPKIVAGLLIISMSLFTISQTYHFGVEQLLDVLINSAAYGLFHLFAISVMQRAIQERQLREQTGILNRDLISTRELLSQTTAQSERVRIARDLHDILGHHMTALILNLEVATHSADEKRQEKVEQSLALAKLLLSDLRTAVSELREEDHIDLEASLKKLLAGIPKLQVELDFSNAPIINNVVLAETLLRCAQESITNIIRHSTATKCWIRLFEDSNYCLLSIADNGVNSSKPLLPGNGLIGMKERVAAAGGSLDWRQEKTGFSLRVQMPLESI